MDFPQIIYLSIALADLIIEFKEDGKPYPEKRSFLKTLMGRAMGITLLVFGGFFDCWIK